MPHYILRLTATFALSSRYICFELLFSNISKFKFLNNSFFYAAQAAASRVKVFSGIHSPNLKTRSANGEVVSWFLSGPKRKWVDALQEHGAKRRTRSSWRRHVLASPLWNAERRNGVDAEVSRRSSQGETWAAFSWKQSQLCLRRNGPTLWERDTDAQQIRLDIW